jgi:hypothetical protein
MKEISLKEYFESRFKSIEKATKTALKAANERLEGMNEFRKTIEDQQHNFLFISAWEAWKEKIDSDIRELRESRAHLAGKASQTSVYISYGIAVVSLIIALLAIFK